MGDGSRLDWAIAMLMSGEMDLLEVLSIFREIGDRFWIANALWVTFMDAEWEGDLLLAKQYMEESLALNREIGYLDGEGAVLTFLGWLQFVLGDPTLVQKMFQSASRK